MKKIYLDIMTTTKDATGLSYDKIRARIEEKNNVSMSTAKLQRIFTGQQDATVPDFEMIIEDGLRLNLMEVYAKMGEQEFRDSEIVDYKGAKELLSEFAADKEQMRQDFEGRIEQAVQARKDAQAAFDTALHTMQGQYAKNAEYLTTLVRRYEEQNTSLTARMVKAEEQASEANRRADQYAAERDKLDKRRHQVFWSMMILVFILVGIVIASFILNIPAIGWGNR